MDRTIYIEVPVITELSVTDVCGHVLDLLSTESTEHMKSMLILIVS